MFIPFNIHLALRTLGTSKLRTGITVGIIALGIMALVGILTAIEGLKSSIYSSFGGMGANTFRITNTLLVQRKSGMGMNISSTSQKNITYREALAFGQRFRFPSTVGISIAARSAATLQYASRKTNPNITVLGIDDYYLAISGTELESGRNFSFREVGRGDYVCILGNSLARNLFGANMRNALNSVITIGYIRYRVVGVAEAKGGSMISNADNIVFIPLQNARSVYGEDRSYVINVSVPNVAMLGFAAEEAEGLFRQIRKLRLDDPLDFSVTKNDNLAAIVVENISFVTGAAIGIGLITLLGAAIGLMNIMLVSVAERTREIGINKALGAKSGTIRMQFLTESVLISLFGGLLGIILGILSGNAISALLHTGFIIPWLWTLFGLLLCTVVGILAGYYPAAKASRLDPITALRYE